MRCGRRNAGGEADLVSVFPPRRSVSVMPTHRDPCEMQKCWQRAVQIAMSLVSGNRMWTVSH